jgi:hypothetical protein
LPAGPAVFVPSLTVPSGVSTRVEPSVRRKIPHTDPQGDAGFFYIFEMVFLKEFNSVYFLTNK